MSFVTVAAGAKLEGQLRPILLVGVLLFTGAVRADAQNDGRRHRFWGGLGVGYGSASFSCDTCRSGPRLGGWDLYLAGGWWPSPQVRLGIEWREWFNGLKKAARLPGIGTFNVLLSYYPRIRGGPFIEAGVGRSWYDLGKGSGDPVEPFSSDTDYAFGAGWGYQVGVGWELHSYTPRVTYVRGNRRTLHAQDGGTVATGWRQNVLLVEVGYRTP